MTRLLLLAHGSPDPRHRRDVDVLADRLRSGVSAVATAYLDHHGPTASQAALQLGSAGAQASSVVVVSLFTAAAYHVGNDVPEVMAQLAAAGARPVQLQPPLPGDAALVDVALGPRPPADSGLTVLFATGSSVHKPVQQLQAQAAEHEARTGCRVAVAFLGGGPGLGEVLSARSAGVAPKHIRVVSFVLADGVLRDRMVEQCRALGLRLAPGTLCTMPAMADLVLSRARAQDRPAAQIGPG